MSCISRGPCLKLVLYVAVNLPEEYCLILDDFAKLIILTTE